MEPITDHLRTVMTATVWDWADSHPDRLTWVVACRRRHESDDWGDLDDDDRAMNAAARRDGEGRLLSVYCTPAELRSDDQHHRWDQLWIITDDIEDPNSFTTILWPADY